MFYEISQFYTNMQEFFRILNFITIQCLRVDILHKFYKVLNKLHTQLIPALRILLIHQHSHY